MARVSRIVAGTLAALAVSTSAARAADPPAPQRPTLYLMESLRTAKLPSDLAPKLTPLQTLQQVEDLLKANHIAFLWRSGEVSSADMNPDLVRQINMLPPHAVFVATQGDGVLIAVVLSSRPAPDTPAAPPAPAKPAPTPPR